MKNFSYYYNNVPSFGLCRNNLIYTSLINDDRTIFVQHYTTEGNYHKGQNEIVDPNLMDEKFNREVKFLSKMAYHNPDMVPKILEIDPLEKKIYLEINGVDFWQQSLDRECSFDEVLPDWQEQMLDIIKAHKERGWHKYSMHPSSYFVVNGRLKSINYFFTYDNSEPNISIADVESHIYTTRQDIMKQYIEQLGIKWTEPQSWNIFDKLCWESFRSNYPKNFIERILNDV